MTASFTYTASKLTVIFTATGSFYSLWWNLGDGTTATGTPVEHTYSSYGTYNVLVTYVEQGTGNVTQRAKVITFTLSETGNGDNNLDVFNDKQLIIPPNCTGDISITSDIQLLEEKITYSTAETKVWAASTNFADVPISGNSSFELYVDPSSYEVHDSDPYIVSADNKIKNLLYVPAFYDRGEIIVEARIGSTEDENSSFNVTCEMELQFPSYPEWYEGTLAFGSAITDNLVNSDNAETNVGTISVGSHSSLYFTMGTWSGIPPIVIKNDVLDYNVDTASQYVTKRGCLSPMQFKFILNNGLSSNVILSSVAIKFRFYYQSNGLLVNLRTSGGYKQEVSRLFTLPNGAQSTRISGVDYPLFGITDGYEDDDIVKVYGFYNQWLDDEAVYYPSCIQLYPIDGMSGIDFPTFLWKSNRIVDEIDFERMAIHGMSTNDYVKVITPEILASSDYYRTIDVTADNDISNSDCNFTIKVSPNTTIDDKVTLEELNEYISTIKYFNVDTPYSNSITVARTDINPIFYETLYRTYKDATVLQSTKGEPLNFVNITINNYAQQFPLYDGGSIELSNNLRHCNDGVRSSEVFYFSNSKANVVNILNPTTYKYKVKFDVKYDVYDDMYVEEDF